MSSGEHLARCLALRGSATESERAIIADLAAAEVALQALYDEQNGAPLLRHLVSWQRAMRLAEEVLTPGSAAPTEGK